MRTHPIPLVQAAACNDNGLPVVVHPALAPRDILIAACRACGPVALLYLAQGSLLVGPARAQPRAQAA